MPYDTKHVANSFLARGFAENQDITPMKLQKLVFYMHGWHLYITDKEAIDENFEA